ncbi:hypothetical protein Pcinc_023381 [Petrolisthes cinctipes]|uniref:RGS domain-containing protein n=1 Tax=Petrolisthes cinctipes TaxID=88211 RepID=A0AAE1FDL4_PETCI|nr:hypothetical protein Pcinc_023381 [Petrolisthes cinctipes]
MSSLWRKFRGGSGGVTATLPNDPTRRCSTSSSPGPDSPRDLTQPPIHLITPQDEHKFMSDVGNDDPLLKQSQFVKTIGDILNNPATLPYFIQFLQGWGADKYTRFWLDANSFRVAAITRVRGDDVCCNVPRNESLVHSQAGGDNSGGCDSKVCASSVVSSEGKLGQTGNQARDKALILPDLVSNIQYASDVTPLNSPQGNSPGTLSSSTRTDHNVKSEEAVVQSKDSEVNSECVNQWPKEILEKTSQKGSRSSLHEGMDTIQKSTSLTLEEQTKLVADDALRLFNKYIAKDAEMPIGVEEEAAEQLKARISVAGEVDPECFVSEQDRVFSTLEKEYLPKFLLSDYYLKHQIDVLTSGSVRLADIIYSDSAFPYFMEYVEQEGGRGILQVWIAVSNFRQQLMETDGTVDGMQAQADAMILYDKYFSLQATCPQGFSDSVRFIVEGNICREEGPLPSCFDLPLRVVLHVLERDFLPGYLSSNLHIKYLSELINTVKTSVELLGRKKRSGSESTCSSEQSGSVSGSVGGSGQYTTTHNTLLATDTRRLRDLTEPSLAMRIDETQLVNPESLWRRQNYSRLSCGFINELGRFESDIQLHPDMRSESRLRKLRRFVMREEDKVREDLAYRVAEMVIRDVTNVTLRQNAPLSEL